MAILQPNFGTKTAYGSAQLKPKQQVLGQQTQQQPSWNQQWNQIWNQAWNAGFNRGSKPSVNPSFNSAVDQGYQAGLGEYSKRSQSLPQIAPPTSLGVQQSSGGSVQQTSGNNQGNGLFETEKETIQPDYTPYDKALADIDTEIANTSSEIPGEEAKLQERGTARKKLIQEGVDVQKKGYEQQKLEESQETEDKKESLRREFLEMQQGLGARYGRSSGTAGFATEILGRSFFETVGRNQRNLQNVLSRIDLSSQEAISQANRDIFENDIRSEDEIKGLKANYQQRIDSLKDSKGRISGERLNLYKDYVKQYNQDIQASKQRNAQFKQNLYLKQVEYDNKVKEKQIGLYKTYSTDLTKQLTSLFKDQPEQFSTEGRQYVESQMSLPAGTFTSEYVDKDLGKDDKKRLSQINTIRQGMGLKPLTELPVPQ